MKLFSILISLGVLSSTQIIELPITKNVELSKPLNKLHEICLETDDLTENGIKAAGDYKYETADKFWKHGLHRCPAVRNSQTGQYVIQIFVWLIDKLHYSDDSPVSQL